MIYQFLTVYEKSSGEHMVMISTCAGDGTPEEAALALAKGIRDVLGGEIVRVYRITGMAKIQNRLDPQSKIVPRKHMR
jgi:hypothetical protein